MRGSEKNLVILFQSYYCHYYYFIFLARNDLKLEKCQRSPGPGALSHNIKNP